MQGRGGLACAEAEDSKKNTGPFAQDYSSSLAVVISPLHCSMALVCRKPPLPSPPDNLACHHGPFCVPEVPAARAQQSQPLQRGATVSDTSPISHWGLLAKIVFDIFHK